MSDVYCKDCKNIIYSGPNGGLLLCRVNYIINYASGEKKYDRCEEINKIGTCRDFELQTEDIKKKDLAGFSTYVLIPMTVIIIIILISYFIGS